MIDTERNDRPIQIFETIIPIPFGMAACGNFISDHADVKFCYCESMKTLQFLIILVVSLIVVDALQEEDAGSRNSSPRRLGHFRHFPPGTHTTTTAGSVTINKKEEENNEKIYKMGVPPNCTELFFAQSMDHFGPSPGAYRQRYFVNDVHHGKGGRGRPMFFYLGNEADVTLYVNATGLMWENAQEFGALVVFAEHRYYGKSQLFPEDPLSNLQYLSSDQALMDYVTLIAHLKKQHGMTESDAVIGFGGSYGGMLASWARFRYPHVWDGVIAASAPILAFEGLEGFFDPNFFAKGLMYDVSTEAGVRSEFCQANLEKAFSTPKALLEVDPAVLRSRFRVCADDAAADVELGESIMNWLNDALAYMAMGNFPYPSGYILNGDGLLPAFPVRAACEFLAEDVTGDDQVEEWLTGLASFAGVYYNYSKSLACNRVSAAVNNESSIVDTLWDYQYCSQLFMVGGQGPDKYDIYWDEPWDGDATAQRCAGRYGFSPDRRHIALSYGTPRDWAKEASNIVWSQGEYDPWKGGGVYNNDDLKDNDSLLSFVIPKAAHHLDLFFSHENDTDEVILARSREVRAIKRWIDEKQRNHRGWEGNVTKVSSTLD